MRALVLLSLVIAEALGWRLGHRGVDRPGPDLLVSDRCAGSPGCCFDLCAATDGCMAWVHTGRTCRLKPTVPAQVAATDPTTCSGVRRAAQDGLRPLAWSSLRLGTVKPSGWLRQQLVLTANGQAGHLELFWDDVMDSIWVGGSHDHSGAGHERGPYWLNGVVPLAAHLNASRDTARSSLDVDLQGQVERWVYYILEHQTGQGWLGPDDGFGGKGNTYWNGWNVAAALLQYADAHKHEPIGSRCEAAVLAYVSLVHSRMLMEPMSSWSQNRWQDWAYIVHWLMDQAPQGQEQLLWDAAELTQQQSWDWDSYYAQSGSGKTGAFDGKPVAKFPEGPVGGWTMWDHGVNNAMGTKSCAVWYRQSNNKTDASAAVTKLTMQDEFHGQPHGMFAADECFGGRALNRGIELCAVVEQMYSLQHNFKVLGDVAWLDRIERIAFNALPGTIDPVQWRHQYLQQANEINARYGLAQHVWQTDGADSTGFGVAPNFGCCTANFVQGWAKFASNVLMLDPTGGLLVAMYAPVSVDLPWGSLLVDTEYPFGDSVTVVANVTSETAVPLRIRVAGWADQATVSVSSGNSDPRTSPALNGTLFGWSCPGQQVTRLVLSLNPKIRLEKGWGLADALGPSPVGYSPAGQLVPTSLAKPLSRDQPSDFSMTGGASVSTSKMPGCSDLRSGGPGQNSTVVLAHPIYGEGHSIESVSFSFRYLCGYNCNPANQAGAPTVAMQVLDAKDHSVLAEIFTSGPLNNYSYDRGSDYSPPVNVAVTGLKIPNGQPVVLALKFANNRHNLQLLIDKLGLNCSVHWSTAVGPGPAPKPPASNLIPGTNAVAVLRGPLLFTLEVGQREELVRSWAPFNNTDVNLDNTTQWNFGLLLDDSHPMTFVRSASGPNRALPFNISNYFATISVWGRQLPGWTEQTNAAAEPPASPVDCATVAGGCGDETQLTFVPYGGTNLRMSGLPWFG